MLTLDQVRTCLPHAIVIMFFPQIADLAVALTPAIARGSTVDVTPAIARGSTVDVTPAIARGSTVDVTPAIALGSETEELVGLDIMGMKGSDGCKPYLMKKEFLTDLFAVRLTKTAKGKILLYVSPLEEPFQLVQRKNGTWRCLFEHQKEHRLLTLEQVVVRGTEVPLSLTFTLHASFRPDAVGPPKHYTIPIEAPRAFASKLREMCLADG